MSDIKLHIEDDASFFARARSLARRLDDGKLAESEDHLSFPDLEVLLRILTPNRWAVLRALKRSGASSIRSLALALKRDDKAVHSDVKSLLEAGLIERGEDGLVTVPWSRLTADIVLLAA